MTTREEADRLWALEAALIDSVQTWGAIYVGRITADGRRDFYFYAASADGFNGVVSKSLEPFGYEFETADEPDAGWAFYFDFLYPTPEDWEKITNRKVLENLRRAGDDLSKPRRIFHWIYFSNESDRDRFIDKARDKGFSARVTPKVARPNHKFPLGLQLHRIDSIAPAAIDAVTLELRTLALANSGHYDGWETQIVKAGREPIDDAPRSDRLPPS